MAQSDLYDFYQMDQYRTHQDLFASQGERDPIKQNKENIKTLSGNHLNIILPNNKAWVINDNLENEIPSDKVFGTWLNKFDKQIPQKVGDVKPHFFIPQTKQGVTRLERIVDGNNREHVPNNKYGSHRKSNTKYMYDKNVQIPNSARDYDDKYPTPSLSYDYGGNHVPLDKVVKRYKYQDRYRSNRLLKFENMKNEIQRKYDSIKPVIRYNTRYNKMRRKHGKFTGKQFLNHDLQKKMVKHIMKQKQTSKKRLSQDCHSVNVGKQLWGGKVDPDLDLLKRGQIEQFSERIWKPTSQQKHTSLIKVGEWGSPVSMDKIIQVLSAFILFSFHLYTILLEMWEGISQIEGGMVVGKWLIMVY